MKKSLIVVFLLSLSLSIHSQNDLGKSDDAARIVLNTFISDDILEELPSARKLFVTKLGQIASRNGMGGGGASMNNRFIISGDINILTKDITATAPTKYLVTIETTLAIGDGIDGKAFSSEFIEFKGIGISEDKAFISAIRKINPRHKLIKQAIKEGKEKIIEYYNSKCDFILKEASALADSKKFDEAVFLLNQVPMVTKECYDKAMDLSTVIYKRKMENECQQNLTKSNSLIAQNKWVEAALPIASYTPDMSCYSDVKKLMSKIGDHHCSISLGKAKGAWARRDSKGAATALSEISFDSSCYNEGVKLFKSISTALDAKAKQEWDLKYEKYNRDQVIKEVVAESQMLDADSRRRINETISETNRLDSESQRGINETISETNRLDSNSQRGINELNEETQRKINSLDAESRRKIKEEMVSVEKRRIDAARDVGVAYGKNQPKTITNYSPIIK